MSLFPPMATRRAKLLSVSIFLFVFLIFIDDAEKFTSEMHDPCAHSRYLQKRTKQEHLIEGTGVEPSKHPPKVKSEIFLQL